MLYFAYGSNMLTERIRARVPSATPHTSARLSGRTLRFDKRSTDGSGKCTLLDAGPESTVYGVVFEVAPDELTALDEAEHRGRGYERCQVRPRTSNGTCDAFAYVAQPAYLDDGLVPYGWYKAFVAAGAHQHNLPDAYQTRLDAVRTYPDPNEHRRTKHRSLVCEAGYAHAWPSA